MNTVTHGARVYRLPFAHLFRPLTDAEAFGLRTSVEVNGVLAPVLLYDSPTHGADCVIDGGHRVSLAAEFGTDLPMRKLAGITDETAEEMAESLNADRRHLTPEEQRERREDRVKRVAAKRKEGKSTRAIAEEEGVSQSQVVADLKAATEQGCSVQPEAVVGKDGKTRPAKKPNPPKEEDKTPARAADSNPEKVSEAGAPKDGPADEGAGEPEAEPEPAPKTPARLVPPPAVDLSGIPVQPHATEAFAAVPKFKELMAAIQTAQRLFNEVANLPGGKFLTLPDVSSYRRGKKQGDGEYADRFVHEGIETAFRQVKNAVPTHTVCPYQYADVPHGDDCRCCNGLNWTPVLSDSTPKVCIERAKAAFGVAGVA